MSDPICAPAGKLHARFDEGDQTASLPKGVRLQT